MLSLCRSGNLLLSLRFVEFLVRRGNCVFPRLRARLSFLLFVLDHLSLLESTDPSHSAVELALLDPGYGLEDRLESALLPYSTFEFEIRQSFGSELIALRKHKASIVPDPQLPGGLGI
ncbi:uncharacterized protein N7459_001813 [Penicillium hispanicum]|uniref:uncharacterized protein n=1 Tax=Penicillium hispanicum TaxID=1080232 RepID=UPI0025424BCA|nr:uncharacterized protein N7459_001813 [Penicillium hispanicum]KAJ5591444.1 hypothetical protein N7459_001813 [Penicillium hispanicum]